MNKKKIEASPRNLPVRASPFLFFLMVRRIFLVARFFFFFAKVQRAADLKFNNNLSADTRGSKILNLHYVSKPLRTREIAFSRKREREGEERANKSICDNRECRGMFRVILGIGSNMTTLLLYVNYSEWI